MTTVAFDLTLVKNACHKASRQAQQAAIASQAIHGEGWNCCGFAWVDVKGVRSNSKLGVALQREGFRRSYSGGLQLWNPSGLPTQSMAIKEDGAVAYATVLRDMLGVRAYAGSRMD